jgi:phage gpG-like protein
MAIKKFGDWSTALRIVNTMKSRFDAVADQALLEEGHYARKLIVTGLRDGAPGGQALKPLSPATLAIRKLKGFKGTKPLLNRGDLRNAIVVKKENGVVFVGILRNAKGKGGSAVANIAEVHEFGSKPIVIRVTPKMQRFLMLAFRKAGIQKEGGGGTTAGGMIIVVQIPARPFFRPVFEAHYSNPDEVAKRFLGRIAARYAGDLGKV